MTIIDANYILRWFLGDVPQQSKEVEQLLSQAGPNTLKVGAVTVAEVTYVLRAQHYNHAQTVAVLTHFLAYPSVIPLDQDSADALSIFSETVLDFEDCYLIAEALQGGAAVATFDKQLLKILQQRKTRLHK